MWKKMQGVEGQSDVKIKKEQLFGCNFAVFFNMFVSHCQCSLEQRKNRCFFWFHFLSWHHGRHVLNLLGLLHSHHILFPFKFCLSLCLLHPLFVFSIFLGTKPKIKCIFRLSDCRSVWQNTICHCDFAKILF